MRLAIAVLACATGCDLVFPPGKGPGVGPADAPGDDVADAAGGDDDGPIADATRTFDAAAFACPPQYSSWTPPSYGLHTGGETWDMANAICLADQATVPALSPAFVHLVVLDDDLELHNVADLSGDRTLWIGATDRRNEGAFWTVTTQDTGYPPSEVGAPWGLDQPDDSGDCVVIMGTGDAFPSLLDDKDCAALQDFMCECDGYPDDPAKY